MIYEKMTPMLTTNDIEATIEFYTKVLDFKCDSVDTKFGWASLTRDNVAVMIHTPNAHIPFERASFTGSFYIVTDEVDTVWANIKDLVSVCYPLEEFDYGMKEFGFYDNNGYLLQFGQAIA